MLRQILLCALLFCGAVSATNVESAALRANVDGRDLGGISWTNLMFRLGVCSISSSCPAKSGSVCKCPDCSKSHQPPPVKKYCSNLSYSSSSESSSSGGGYDSSYAAASNGYEEEGYETSAFSADASSLSRPWWWLLIVAAAFVIGAGAYYLRQRQLAAAGAKSEAAEKLVGEPELDYKHFETASNAGTEPIVEDDVPAIDESVETADYTSMGDRRTTAAGAAGLAASRSMSPASGSPGNINRSRSWWQKVRGKSKSAVV